MTETLEGQMSIYDLGIWSWRTSPEHSVPETRKERTSGSSSKKQRGSRTQMPLFLDLRNGRTQDASWVTGILSHGRSTTPSGGAFLSADGGYVCSAILTGTVQPTYYLTLNIGERPREPMPSKLSEILEENPDPKYRLSARACQGILTRASRRGKDLPEILKTALENQIHEQEASSDPQN